MNFYKIIIAGKIVDANCIYLKWQQKHHILIGCEASEAQFIQSSDQSEVWRAKWLNPAPPEAGEYDTVEAVEITEEEYIALRKKLGDGETVVEPDVQQEAPTAEEPEGEEIPVESVMSAAEMRRIIAAQAGLLAKQQDRLNFLEDCILEMSEELYK